MNNNDLTILVNEHGWDYVCKYHTLTEDEIREHKDEVNWDLVLLNQNISDSFISEFKDRINWKNLQEKLDVLKHRDKSIRLLIDAKPRIDYLQSLVDKYNKE